MSKKVEIRDFSNRRYFPGTHGNPFDVLLHRYNRIEDLPAPVFALLLFALAVLATWGNWPKFAILFGFFLGDWLLLHLLPECGMSYGPAKPPTLALAALRSLVGWTPLAVNLPLQFLGTLLVIYGFWIEPHRIRLTRQSLRTPKIKPGQGIRLLHIGDLHLEQITRRELQLQEMITSLKPDVILFSGDVLSLSNLSDSTALQQARELLSSWKAPHGVYAVAGSPAVDLPELLPQIYTGLPIRFLANESADLDIRGSEIRLIGLNCTHKPFMDANYLPDPSANDGKLQILLYHSPDLAPQAAGAGIDLQLSGHTHGGQVRLPLFGAIFTGTLHGRRYNSGRYHIGDMILYITRGLGMEGAGAPRVRFLSPPELILWELSAA